MASASFTRNSPRPQLRHQRVSQRGQRAGFVCRIGATFLCPNGAASFSPAAIQRNQFLRLIHRSFFPVRVRPCPSVPVRVRPSVLIILPPPVSRRRARATRPPTAL